jgi:hypothetical protein
VGCTRRLLDIAVRDRAQAGLADEPEGLLHQS